MTEYFDGRLQVHVLSRAKETFLYNAAFQWRVSRYLAEFGRSEGFDIVHSHHAHMPHILYGFRHNRLPIITTVHTTIEGQRQSIRASRTPFNRLEPSERWQILLYPELRLAERAALQTANRFVTMSRWMFDQLRQRWPEIATPIDIVPNGVHSGRFLPERMREDNLLRDVDSPIVLISSRLTAAKGIEFAVEAMKAVLAERKDVLFVFAGARDAGFWPHYVKSRGIPPAAVRFLGYVPYDSLPPLYARATVYLLPTLYENVPLRMLEAMCAGAPVIASRVCGIPEVIRHRENGLLVPPGDSGSIADAIRLLLDDEALAKRLGQRGRQTVLEQFDWKVVGRKTVDSYRRALGEMAG